MDVENADHPFAGDERQGHLGEGVGEFGNIEIGRVRSGVEGDAGTFLCGGISHNALASDVQAMSARTRIQARTGKKIKDVFRRAQAELHQRTHVHGLEFRS